MLNAVTSLTKEFALNVNQYNVQRLLSFKILLRERDGKSPLIARQVNDDYRYR